MNDNTQSRSTMRYWVLSVLGVALAAVACGLVVAAFTIARPAAGVVLETEPAGVAPLTGFDSVTTTTTTVGEIDEPVASPENVPTPEPPSASEVETAQTEPVKIPPVSLVIDDLRLDYDGVVAVGLDDRGAMEVPSVEEVGWYLHGAAPGRDGATVLVAHVWWNGDPGPFRRLGRLDLGADIEIRTQDGEVHTYQVVQRAMYDKDELPSHLWRNSGPETLVLITCGGEFNSNSRRFEQNVVVYAVPTADAHLYAS